MKRKKKGERRRTINKTKYTGYMLLHKEEQSK